MHIGYDALCGARPPMDGAQLMRQQYYEDIIEALRLPPSRYFEALRLFTAMHRCVRASTHQYCIAQIGCHASASMTANRYLRGRFRADHMLKPSEFARPMSDEVFGGMNDLRAKFAQYRINGDMLDGMTVGPAALAMEVDPVRRRACNRTCRLVWHADPDPPAQGPLEALAVPTLTRLVIYS